ncbi:Type IV secretory system Conjugative DNA transfer, partial [Eubacterium uniforme]
LLGKWTIYKKSSSESKGSHGSSSNSVDVIARDLMDPNEIRLLPNNKEIVFVRGERALMDFKWYPWKHKINSYAMSYGTFEPKKYMDLIRRQREESNDYYELIIDNKQKIDYYLSQKESGNVIETTVNISSFLNYNFDEDNDKSLEDNINELVVLSDEEIEKIISEEEFLESKRITREKKKLFNEMDLIGLYASDVLDERRKEILKSLYKLEYTPEQIKDIISLDRDLDEIEQLYEASIVLKG